MQINSQDWPEVQLNETINMSPEGKVLSRSLMINLRNSKAESVWKAYQELKVLIDSKKNEPEKEQNKKVETCPRCGAQLVEKQGISKKNFKPYHFHSCSAWPKCDFSKPFVPDQDLIDADNIPF